MWLMLTITFANDVLIYNSLRVNCNYQTIYLVNGDYLLRCSISFERNTQVFKMTFCFIYL